MQVWCIYCINVHNKHLKIGQLAISTVLWKAYIFIHISLPRKASTRQLTPLMALKKIWGSCLRQGCSTTSCGMLLELRNCSWNFGVVLTIAGLLKSTGLLAAKKYNAMELFSELSLLQLVLKLCNNRQDSWLDKNGKWIIHHLLHSVFLNHQSEIFLKKTNVLVVTYLFHMES